MTSDCLWVSICNAWTTVSQFNFFTEYVKQCAMPASYTPYNTSAPSPSTRFPAHLKSGTCHIKTKGVWETSSLYKKEDWRIFLFLLSKFYQTHTICLYPPLSLCVWAFLTSSVEQRILVVEVNNLNSVLSLCVCGYIYDNILSKNFTEKF